MNLKLYHSMPQLNLTLGSIYKRVENQQKKDSISYYCYLIDLGLLVIN